jgi:hypothetical protein
MIEREDEREEVREDEQRSQCDVRKKEREKAEMVRIERGIVWKSLNILVNL